MAKRRIPADMLLLRARMLAGAQAPAGADSTGILASDEDELVLASPGPADADALTFYRPVDDVHVGSIGWQTPIDHGALQAALACTDTAPAGGRRAVLEISIARVDIAWSARFALDRGAAAAAALDRALHLPDRLSGASASATHALAIVLAGYRHASLAYVWAQRLGLALEWFARERNETALSLVSTLRAVLGEW